MRNWEKARELQDMLATAQLRRQKQIQQAAQRVIEKDIGIVESQKEIAV